MRTGAGAALPTAVLAAALALPATAASAAPVVLRGSWTTGVTVPDPTTGGLPAQTCEGVPASRSRHVLRLPSSGVLRLVLTSTGDYALAARDAHGRALGRADSAVLDPERLQVRVRGGGRVLVDACNFAGAPTARVSWTFTRTA